MMFKDMARQLDPARWFHDAGITADDWQTKAIRSQSKRQLWLCHRQAGKSTTAGLKALAKAQEPGSLTLLISPAQRQSAELLRKVSELCAAVPGLPKPLVETQHKLEFAHGGRIISLPSSETTVRGYSKVGLLILDEASRIPDEIVSAVRPMMAVAEGGGELVCLSTPNGRQGFFYESWQNGGSTWERTKIAASECSRISAEFLKEEEASLGPMMYRQEYLCEFCDTVEQMFASDLISRAFTTEVVPLWQ